MERLLAKFERRLDGFQGYLTAILAEVDTNNLKKDDLYKLESFLSDLWQVWGRFCRDLTVSSCTGCIDGLGNPVAGTHPNWEAVSYIAWRQNNGSPPSVVGTNSILRKEPTWGHVDKLIDVINALNPSNKSKLLLALGTVPKIEHIRLIRNCTAHKNMETFADVIAFQSAYGSFRIRHVIQALFWHDIVSSQILISARMDDMRIAARNAIS